MIQIRDQNSKKESVVERGAIFGQVLTFRIWIVNLNFDKIGTVMLRAVDLSAIQFLSIFGVLLTEMCY